MKVFKLGFVPCLLSAFVSEAASAHLRRASGVPKHRKQPSKKNLLAKVRDALASKTEELNNQKNIAHGLELEVRELQGELEAEKKALASEVGKEHALQQKLNKVREVIDGSTVPESVVRTSVTNGASSAVHAPSRNAVQAASPGAPFKSEVDPLANSTESNEMPVAVQPHRVEMTTSLDSPLDDVDDGVREESNTGIRRSNEGGLRALPITKQGLGRDTTKANVRTQKTKIQPSSHRQPPVNRSSLKASHTKRVSKKTVHPHPKKTMSPRPAKQIPAKVAVIPKPTTPKLNSTAVLTKARPTPTEAVHPTPTSSKEVGLGAVAGAGADFDALEAQLHEEDRRIQDLDRENALDITDAGPPSGASAPNRATLKPLPAQKKLEIDSDAPMEDFLNVEPPGPESQGQATTPQANVPDMSPAEEGVALPQLAESVGTGMDGVLSDEKFLAQMAPASKH